MSDNNKIVSRRNALKVIGSSTVASLSLSSPTVGKQDGQNASSEYKKEKRAAEQAFSQSLENNHERHTPSVSQNSGDLGAEGTTDPRADVYVGTDTTLNPDYGDKYTSDDASSSQDAVLQASYNTTDDWIQARAYDHAGYGTFRAWSYIAREFVAHGSGTATFTVRPDICGDMGIATEGDNEAFLELTIKDFDANQEWDEYVFNYSTYVDEWCNDDKVDSKDVSLTDGHGYSATVKLTVGTTFTGDAGGAESDFRNKSGDEIVNVGNIDVTF